MPKQLFIAIIFCLLLTACGTQPIPAATLAPSGTANSVATRATSTPSSLAPATSTPTATRVKLTSTPREPHHEPTSTITPLPTIPTFDVRTIVTATPAPKAECPKENSALIFLTPAPEADPSTAQPQDSRQQYILDFLNAGGKPEKVVQTFSIAGKDTYYIKDVTSDGIPEFIFNWGNVSIFQCKNEIYSLIYEIENPITDAASGIYLFYVGDMNLDGIPELLIGGRAAMGTYSTFAHTIIEWDGQNFRNMILPGDNLSEWRSDGWLFTEGLGKNSSSIWSNWKIKDTDKNGTFDLVLSGELPIGMDRAMNGPWRAVTKTYTRNGTFFAFRDSQIEPAIYRFQAIQDADQLFSEADYAKSLEQYQEVIFNDQLKPWSPELDKNFRALTAVTYYHSSGPTPTLVAPDLTEYPRLAAYAYYRMVILHAFLGEMDAAQVKYATLQEKFPAGNPGQPYAEMATAFWDAYQSTHKLYDGCAAAIGYAAAHPEILTPLGSDYHGAQSHTYVPADICPLR